MKTTSLLNTFFEFIDSVQITGTLSFPLRTIINDPESSIVRPLSHHAQLIDKRFNGLPQEQFQSIAAKKAEQTVNLVHCDVIDSAKSILSAMDKYLSAMRDIDKKLDELKIITGQEIRFENETLVEDTPPEVYVKIEYNEYKALNESLSKYLMWIRESIDDTITLLKHTQAYSAFLTLLREKTGLENADQLTDREEILLFKYKVDAREIATISPKEIGEIYGSTRRKKYYELWNPKGKTYRAPQIEELKTIIPLLTEFPIAQKAAINDLDRLISAI